MTKDKDNYMGKVAAVVLAGGRGSRMGTLCTARPKPALSFGGIHRVINFSLENCAASGIGNIIALVDYQRAYMAAYLRQWNSADNPGSNIHIREPKTGSYQGTADAVYQNLDLLRETGAEAVLVLAADHVYRMDYRKMYDFHRRNGADVTIGVVPVPVERAHQFGIVATDGEDRITAFQEKPEVPNSDLASMGIYIFNTDVLTRHLLRDALRTDSSHDFGYSLIPGLLENERVFAYRFEGYWQDIGTPEAYYQAHMDLLNGGHDLYLNDALPAGNSRLALPRENVRNSIVGENCIINGRVENSVLSPGVFVAEDATVRNAVVMAGSFIGYGSSVSGCILDEAVQVGEYARIGATLPAGGRQVPVISRGTVIPDFTHTGYHHQMEQLLGLYTDSFSSLLLPEDLNDEDLLSIIRR